MRRLLRQLLPFAVMTGVLTLLSVEAGRERAAGGCQAAEARGIEVGNTFVGLGSANWPYGHRRGFKFALAFTAAHTGTLTGIRLNWKTANGYGAGDFGVWDAEIQTDQPQTRAPSGTAIARVTGFRPFEGFPRIPLPDVPVTASTRYHLVLANMADDPEANWSSPNTIITAEAPDASTMTYDRARWWAWGQQPRPPHPARGCRAAYCLQYADGSVQGAPYYSAMPCRIFGGRYAGERFTWRRAAARVARVGFSTFRLGAPAGPLRFALEEVGGEPLAGGVVQRAAEGGESPEWRYVALDPPVALRTGATYRLYLLAPECAGEQDCYGTYVPYSSEQVPEWKAMTWLGADGVSITRVDGAWHAATLPADLTFSLQVVE